MAHGGPSNLVVDYTAEQLAQCAVGPAPMTARDLAQATRGVRMGLHVNDPLGSPGDEAWDLFAEWVRVVRPNGIKLLDAAYDPRVVDLCRSLGVKVVCRRVQDMPSLGPDGRAVLYQSLNWARERGFHMDYLEFANEEWQGKDDPRDWDRLCEYMLEMMQALDRETGGRVKAVVLNCSVGQPELERWTRPACIKMLEYAALKGHLIGIHEYYKPRPWQGVEGPWRNWGRVEGWWMLRLLKVVRRLRARGIPVPQFAITESGRDNVPGCPGVGSGFRDEPITPDGAYADFMFEFGMHLSSGELAGVVAIWVDFGFNARKPTEKQIRDGAKDWTPFSLRHDVVMCRQAMQRQLLIPREKSVSTVDLAALYAEGQRHQCIEVNPAAGITLSALDRFKVAGPQLTSRSWVSQAAGVAGMTCERWQYLDTGKVLIGCWKPGTVLWYDVTAYDRPK